MLRGCTRIYFQAKLEVTDFNVWCVYSERHTVKPTLKRSDDDDELNSRSQVGG